MWQVSGRSDIRENGGAVLSTTFDKEEKIIFKATMISAAVNLILNLILIPFLAQNAAAFAL